MISGLAVASQALDKPEYRELAIAAANFIKSNLYQPETGILLRSYREGPSDIEGFLDDYRCVKRHLGKMNSHVEFRLAILFKDFWTFMRQPWMSSGLSGRTSFKRSRWSFFMTRMAGFLTCPKRTRPSLSA